jgi:selT/selW/selH-like putative selenoprotein
MRVVAIEIRHCPTCKGFDKKAARLAAALSDAGHPAVATVGAKAQFDVFADGELVFSRREDGSFPRPHEILRALAERTSAV